MPQYEHAESSGVVEAVERKTSSNNREFAEITISGVQYTSWEEMLTKQAEMMQQAGCTVNLKARAKVMDNGKVSQYWQVTEMVAQGDTPTNGGHNLTPGAGPWNAPAPAKATQAAAPILPAAPARWSDEQIRTECLNLAIKAHATHEEIKDVNVIVAYAEALEAHIRGTLPKEVK